MHPMRRRVVGNECVCDELFGCEGMLYGGKLYVGNEWLTGSEGAAWRLYGGLHGVLLLHVGFWKDDSLL